MAITQHKHTYAHEARTKTGRSKLMLKKTSATSRLRHSPDLRMLNRRWQPFQSPTQWWLKCSFFKFYRGYAFRGFYEPASVITDNANYANRFGFPIGSAIIILLGVRTSAVKTITLREYCTFNVHVVFWMLHILITPTDP